LAAGTGRFGQRHCALRSKLSNDNVHRTHRLRNVEEQNVVTLLARLKLGLQRGPAQTSSRGKVLFALREDLTFR
jgi:hypothetical protein